MFFLLLFFSRSTFLLAQRPREEDEEDLAELMAEMRDIKKICLDSENKVNVQDFKEFMTVVLMKTEETHAFLRGMALDMARQKEEMGAQLQRIEHKLTMLRESELKSTVSHQGCNVVTNCSR